jgi:hypothetical protein
MDGGVVKYSQKLKTFGLPHARRRARIRNVAPRVLEDVSGSGDADAGLAFDLSRLIAEARSFGAILYQLAYGT